MGNERLAQFGSEGLFGSQLEHLLQSKTLHHSLRCTFKMD